ncbi:hypothetical protein [Eshraghiella crossota]|uniref:hypothetical protein n=1 Tax=Eshraghiella crossota TaxID=45851 RepID=UPI004028FB2D
MELETLEIKIQAQARQASGQIDALVTRLGRLSSALSGLSTGNLNSLATGVKRLSSSMSAMRSVDTRTFSALARNLNKLSGINATGLNNVSNAIGTISGSIRALSGIDFKGNGLNAFINSVTKLSSTNLGSLSRFDFGSLGNKINQLSNSLSGAKKVQGNTIQLVNAIGRLASSSENMAETASSLPSLGRAIRSVTNSLSSAKAVSENIIKFTSAIGQLAIAGKKTAQTASNLGILATELKKFMQVMSNAPVLNNNIIQMTQAIAQLASSGGRAENASKSFSNMFSGYSSSASVATKKSFSLASAIGKLYATYWTLFRVFRLLRDSIDISSSLTEVENVVRQTFGQYESLINNFAKTSIEKFGMSELSAKQFASRFQAMGTALDIPQGKMAKMSIRLTELAGDMASFYDVSQEDIAKSLQSVFSGTTAPMRRYGIDLTQATLKEWALKQGLDANISSMTQAQKAMLRYQYVLAHTTNITGDFARTADTWHNQITMLKENFKALGAVVGSGLINAFKPFIKALNSVLQKVIAFAEMVTNALGSIFGWKYEASKGAGLGGLADDIGSASDGMDDLSDAAGSAGKNTGDVAKNAKKAKKEIQQATRAFDELKVISKQSKDKKSGSGNKGSGSGAGGGTGADGGLVQTDTIFKKFKSDIKDLEGLGESIRDALVNAVGGIEWDKIYAKASGFGTGLAEFLNGLFSEDKKGNSVFTATADVIAGALNTAIFASKGFTDKFDFETFGKNVAHGFNRFFKKFKWKQCAEAINGWVDGFWNFAVGFFGDLSWSDILNGLKTFLTSLSSKTIATLLGAYALKKFGKSTVGALADSVGGQTLTAKIKEAFFTVAAITIAAEGGLTIGEAIGKKIAELTQPEEMQQYQTTFNFSDLFSYSLDDWEQGFSDWWDDTFGPAFELMALDMATGNYKFKIPFTDFELPSLNEAKKGFSNWLSGVNKYWGKKKDSVLEIGAKIKNKASELWSGFKKDWKNGKEKAAEFKTKISSKAKDLWEKFKTSWGNSKVASFLLKIGSKAKDLWDKFKTAWGETKTAKFLLKIGSKISELWKNFKDSWGEKKTVKFLTKRATKISELWKDFKDSWGDRKAVTIGIGFAKDSLNNLWSSVKGFFGGKTVSVGTKATKKADGGVFSGGSWKPIKKYAVGGLPNMGQMFVAREAGPELVGTLGGHTAVMNNDQIVSSVSYGVAQAVKEVIQPLLKASVGNNRPIQISLDGKVIFDSTRQSAQEYFNRTGRSPYPV